MSKNHYKSDCNYHIILCPKYRHKVIKNKVKSFLKKKIEEVCSTYNYELLDISLEPDHVHVAIKLLPTYSIGSVIRNIKSTTGYYVLNEFPELKKKYFWNSKFWTNSYYVSTVGTISKEKVIEYIKSQENYVN